MRRMTSLYIRIDVANRVFGATNAAPERHLLGVVRMAGSPRQYFELINDDAAPPALAADDIPVVHAASVGDSPYDRVLTVITDTRGVMQLRASRRGSAGLEVVEIRTEDG
jgi:hypothetical protein